MLFQGASIYYSQCACMQAAQLRCSLEALLTHCCCQCAHGSRAVYVLLQAIIHVIDQVLLPPKPTSEL
jgi:hypothetical protein